jgi:hypothetical protein
MNILIHTYGRAAKQITWHNLPHQIQMQTRLVVQDREAHLYYEYPLIVVPSYITKLAETRQWLAEHMEWDHMIIVDDDLDFAVRREDEPTKFVDAPPAAIQDMFNELQSQIMGGFHMLAGVSGREGANRDTDTYKFKTRQMRIHAINLNKYRELGIRFDRVEVMEDFDVTLQFLEAGYHNIVLNTFVTNQRGSNTLGGCSHYRTPEVQTASAYRLAELHPGIVKVVKKKTKTSWGGEERTDVIVSWKKAYRGIE